MSQNSLDFALAQHGERHGEDGDDPITPQMIGAEPKGAALAAAEAAASAIADAVADLAPFNDDGDVLDENANVLARADLSNVDSDAIDAAVGPALSGKVDNPTSFVGNAVLGSGGTSGDDLQWTTSQVVVARALGWLIATDPAYGAVGDGQSVGTGAITAAGNTLTATGAGFTAADVGKAIVIAGAGASGGNLTTTITARTSSTIVTLAANASTTVSAAAVSWGTDDTTAIQAMLTAAGPGGRHCFMPAPRGGSVGTRHYVLTGALTIQAWEGLAVSGTGWETCEVRQYKDNTPIFRFPTDNTHSLLFEAMRLTWAVPQTYAASPRSAAFARDNTDGTSSTSGVYFHSYRDLKVVGGTYGWVILRAGGDTTSVNPWWGSEWSRILFTNMNRACITLNMGAIGAPCNHFSNIKIFQSTALPNDGNEAAITIRGEATLENVDIEKWHNAAVSIPSANYVTFRGLHIEHHYCDNNTGGNRLIYIAGSTVEIDGLYVSYDSTDSFNKFAVYTDNNAVVDVRGVVFTTPQHGNSYLFGGSGTPGNAHVTARGINPSGPIVDTNVYLWQAGSGYVGNVVAIEGGAPFLRSGDSLPTAGSGFRYRVYIVPGNGSTTADQAVQCLQTASGSYTWTTIGSPNSPAAPNIQVFLSSGIWNKPPNTTTTRAYVLGGGGGGGAGRRGAAGSLTCGGGGGGGAGRSWAEFATADLTSTVTVTVGAAGTGAAAQTADSTDGASGTNGGESSFGAYLFARKGGGGGGGTAAAGAAGAAGGNGTAGGAASGAGAAGGTSQAANGGASGGGAGGGLTAGDVASAGGTSFYPADAANNTSAGGSVGNAGTAGVSRTANEALAGPGGGGGGASTTGAGGSGGAAGSYGGGGGGGGASRNGNASGAGGNGAPGIVVVISH